MPTFTIEGSTMSVNCVAIDDSWGPWAGPCRGGLDFTLLFEESIFSILPTAVLILTVPLYATWLRGRTKKARKGLLLPLKEVRDPNVNPVQS